MGAEVGLLAVGMMAVLGLVLGGGGGGDNDDAEPDPAPAAEDAAEQETGAPVVGFSDVVESMVAAPQAAPAAITTIFDDTFDADDGMIAGTGLDETLIGSVQAGGLGGAEADTTTPNDTITAGGGDDTVFAGIGADSVQGGTGSDDLQGGTGDDTLEGGDGNDTLTGGAGANTLTGGAGNDTFVIQDDGDADRITDFSNETGNRDFLDLTEQFRSVEEAVAAYTPGTGTLQLTNEMLLLPANIEASFTPETTGLALNQAPEGQDDTIGVTVVSNTAGGVALAVVAGNAQGAAADTDVDGDVSDLRIDTVDGMAVAPGGNVTLGSGVSVALQPNGQTLVYDLDVAADLGNADGTRSFTYTVVDAFGARSAPATVTLNFTVL